MSVGYPTPVDEAAALYDAAVGSDLNPTAWVASCLSVSRATASRYIREARNQGLLPECDPGKVAANTKRPPTAAAVAIAAELGVEPAALIAAVKRHASGRFYAA